MREQKQVILSLVKLLVSKQGQFLRQLHKDQKGAYEVKAELDDRYSAYKSGKTKMISSAQSKMRIGKLLKTRKVK